MRMRVARKRGSHVDRADVPRPYQQNKLDYSIVSFHVISYYYILVWLILTMHNQPRITNHG